MIDYALGNFPENTLLAIMKNKPKISTDDFNCFFLFEETWFRKNWKDIIFHYDKNHMM